MGVGGKKLGDAIGKIIEDRGFNILNRHYEVRDDSDGNGPKLVKWDVNKLGQIPTKIEIESAIKTVEIIDPTVEEKTEKYRQIAELEQAKGVADKKNDSIVSNYIAVKILKLENSI